MVPASGLNRWLASFRSLSADPRELATLRQENQFLRSQIQAAKLYLDTETDLKRQITDLRSLVGLPDLGKTKVPAEIVAYFPYDNRITINIGKNQGILPKSPVLTGNGLLGQVTTVGDKTSQVTLISSPTLRLGGLVSGQDAVAGLLRGETPSRLAMDLVAEIEVKAGDIVVTSGVTEQVPRGIKIGTVNRVDIDREFGYRRAYILPSASVSDGPAVVVLK